MIIHFRNIIVTWITDIIDMHAYDGTTRFWKATLNAQIRSYIVGWSYSKCNVASGPPTYAAFVTHGKFCILQLQVTKSNFCGSLHAWEQGYIIICYDNNQQRFNSCKFNKSLYACQCQTTHDCDNIVLQCATRTAIETASQGPKF